MRLSFFIGILAVGLFLRFLLFYHNQIQYKDGQYLNFETVLFSEPSITGKYQSISANLASGEKIFIKIPLYPQFYYGNSVRISGTLKRQALINRKIVMTMFLPKVEAVRNRSIVPFDSLLAVTSFIRQKVIYFFQKSLPPTYSSLLLGIVFGIKEQMPKDFFNALKSAGVLHVIAASGMNVTIVGGFLSSILGLFFKRQIALSVSIFGILFYAFLSGFEASIIRASIMGILVFSSQIWGRQSLASYGLLITGFVMLFINPNLLWDVGFQLSFLATLGLLYIKPIFDKSMIGSMFGTTIAAQTATLPVLLTNFGTYSFWSVLVNGLVLWTVPILMVIGAAGATVGFIIFPLAQFILYFALPFLIYFEKVVVIFGAFPGIVSFSSIPWQLIVGYYILLLALILKR